MAGPRNGWKMGNSKRDKIDLSWAKALEEELGSVDIDDPGPDWKTCRQVAEDTGVSQSHASWKIRNMVMEGRAEMKKFRILAGGKPYPVPHYRLIKK